MTPTSALNPAVSPEHEASLLASVPTGRFRDGRWRDATGGGTFDDLPVLTFAGLPERDGIAEIDPERDGATRRPFLSLNFRGFGGCLEFLCDCVQLVIRNKWDRHTRQTTLGCQQRY